MCQTFWLKIFLNYILSFLSKEVDPKIFKKIILGIILQEKYFTMHRISKTTQDKSLWQLYDFMERKINWKNLNYQLAKLVIHIFGKDGFYLVIDGTPLEQIYSENRITKRGRVNVSRIRNNPLNELISIGLTNEKIYIPLDFDIWVNPDASKPRDYKKKTEIFLNLLKKYLLMKIPVKTVMFDSFYTSKQIIRFVSKKEFVWITRLKNNRTIFVENKSYFLERYGLGYGRSVVCKINGTNQLVKIVKFKLQDEDVYVCTNNINVTNKQLKADYRKRWEVEIFHREAKQKLGLENIMMQSWRKLMNHVGFVCLTYSILSILKQLSGNSIADTKFNLLDEVLGFSSSIETFEQKLAA